MSGLALLLSLLALGLVACDDDDETATAETEVITSDFAQDPPGRGGVAVAGGPNACGDYRKGPGAIRVRIEVFEGIVRCREARRVLKSYYPRDRSTPPWSCVDYTEDLVQCTRPGAAFRGILTCRARPSEVRAACPGFPAGELLVPDSPDPGLDAAPTRTACGHLRPLAPPGEYPLIHVDVVLGNVPCRVARRVLRTQYRDDAVEPPRPWRCAGPEGLIVCGMYRGAHHKAIRARFRE